VGQHGPGFLSPGHNLLAPLLNTYPAARIWEAAIHSLGYPPTWIDTPSELEVISQHLIKETNDDRRLGR
jgi:hypothetical protein